MLSHFLGRGERVDCARVGCVPCLAKVAAFIRDSFSIFSVVAKEMEGFARLMEQLSRIFCSLFFLTLGPRFIFFYGRNHFS